MKNEDGGKHEYSLMPSYLHTLLLRNSNSVGISGIEFRIPRSQRFSVNQQPIHYK